MTLTEMQQGRIRRAGQVLREERQLAPDTAEIIGAQAAHIGRLQYWLDDMLSLIAELVALDGRKLSPSEYADLAEHASRRGRAESMAANERHGDQG